MEALQAQARHNLDGYPAWFQHRSMNMTKKTEVRTEDCHISCQTRRQRSQKSWVLIWDKCAERCRQRGRKGRYNYVIREGGSGIERRVEGGVHISVSAPVRLRQLGCSTDTAYHLVDGELHSFVCLRKHAATWVWRERIGTKKGWSFMHFHHEKTNHLKDGHAQLWKHAQMAFLTFFFFLVSFIKVADSLKVNTYEKASIHPLNSHSNQMLFLAFNFSFNLYKTPQSHQK